MAWIRVVDTDEAEGDLKAAYERIAKRRGKVANVVKVASLLPDVMEANLDYYMALMYGRNALPRPKREMIATEVSRLNGCDYCIHHHGAALGRAARDEAFAEAFMADGAEACDDPADRAMLAYAKKLTEAPGDVAEADVEALREAGFSDEQVLVINHVTALFNMYNRAVEGLGVELEPDKGKDEAYKYD